MQLDLFELHEPPPASRATDPETSAIAEREITLNGSRAGMEAFALKAVSMYPGRSANELETLLGVKDGTIRKRLNDLWRSGFIRKGPVRKSSVTGKSNQTWFLV